MISVRSQSTTSIIRSIFANRVYTTLKRTLICTLKICNAVHALPYFPYLISIAFSRPFSFDGAKTQIAVTSVAVLDHLWELNFALERRCDKIQRLAFAALLSTAHHKHHDKRMLFLFITSKENEATFALANLGHTVSYFSSTSNQRHRISSKGQIEQLQSKLRSKLMKSSTDVQTDQ